jgi:hypothetical protein
LWSECEAGETGGFVGGYETPDLDTGYFSSGEVPLEPGVYYLDMRTFCVVDWDTWFYGSLRIVERFTIDIEALSTINPRSRGVTPVAIFGSDYLDVASVDVETLRFGPGQASTKHDLSDPWIYNEHLQDLNLDGFIDLVAHFPTRESGFDCEDESALLTADLIDESSIEGEDSIRVIGCKPNRPIPTPVLRSTLDAEQPAPRVTPVLRVPREARPTLRFTVDSNIGEFKIER